MNELENKEENSEVEEAKNEDIVEQPKEIITEKIVYVEKKMSKKKLIIVILVLLLILGIFIWWWFNRKFNVTFIYNNGDENNVVKVKYLNKIKDEDVKKDLSLANYSFVGYYEVYYLSGKDIEKIRNNSELENNICKKKFKLDNSKLKCIAINEFDFKNTKINGDKTIEVLWSTITFNINPTEKQIYVGDSFDISVTISGTNDTKVIWTSEDSNVAKVSDSGRVVGNKVGKTNVYAESNGIRRISVVSVIEKEQPKQEVKEEPKTEVKEEPKQEVKEEPKTEVKEEPKREIKEEVKDLGTVKLSANDQCIIGTNKVIVTATLNNALDDTINWSNLKCFDIEKISNDKVSISRIGRGTMCRSIEEVNPVITATLNNGNSDFLKFNYESKLSITVYDGRGNILNPDSRGIYKGNNIKVISNVDANFEVVKEWNSSSDVDITKTNNSVIVNEYITGSIRVYTTCGQSITIKVEDEIN